MRLSRLPESLAAQFGPVESTVPDRSRGNAAVAVILRPPPGPADPPLRRCDFLAIRRAESASDPWSGQMALPGGRLDAADPGLLFAAIRETREETGVDLNGMGAVLGRTETLRPLAVRIPAITIWPFVFRVGTETSAHAASREVASVHWFSVEALEDPANRGTCPWEYRGVVRRFPCVRVGDRVIWGLTYRVLTRFLEAAVEGTQHAGGAV